MSMTHLDPSVTALELSDSGQPSRVFLQLVEGAGACSESILAESLSAWLAQTRSALTLLHHSTAAHADYLQRHNDVSNMLWLLDGQLDALEALLLMSHIWAHHAQRTFKPED